MKNKIKNIIKFIIKKICSERMFIIAVVTLIVTIVK